MRYRTIGKIAFIFCAICTFSTFSVASSDVQKRFWALQKSDPELFRLIMRLIKKPDVPGGFDLKTRSAELDCQESYGKGFNSCSAIIRVSITNFSDYPDNRSATLQVKCTADLQTKREGSYIRSSTIETKTEDIFSYGGGDVQENVEIEFLFNSFSPTISAKITDAKCEIVSIY
ncbi:MAG: hypothetical protein OXN81_12500 [Alphaproteobacteria bacterium]|nr:hypothetical protein [Alphaproteobacteria bacterium]